VGLDPWVNNLGFGNQGSATDVLPTTYFCVTTGAWPYPQGSCPAYTYPKVYVGNPDGSALVHPFGTPTLRLKLKRDGFQDYEYLKALTTAGQGNLVTTQISSWITNRNSYEYTGTGLMAARQALGTKLHQLTSWSGSGNSPCDVNNDGQTTVVDVQLEVNMALGISPCTNASGTCTVVSVQRVVNAALGGQCVNP
jgi:hypothetical protein